MRPLQLPPSSSPPPWQMWSTTRTQVLDACRFSYGARARPRHTTAMTMTTALLCLHNNVCLPIRTRARARVYTGYENPTPRGLASTSRDGIPRKLKDNILKTIEVHQRNKKAPYHFCVSKLIFSLCFSPQSPPISSLFVPAKRCLGRSHDSFVFWEYQVFCFLLHVKCFVSTPCIRVAFLCLTSSCVHLADGHMAQSNTLTRKCVCVYIYMCVIRIQVYYMSK